MKIIFYREVPNLPDIESNKENPWPIDANMYLWEGQKKNIQLQKTYYPVM